MAQMVAKLQTREERRRRTLGADERADDPRARAVRRPPRRAGRAGQRALGGQPAPALGLVHAGRPHASGCPAGCRAMPEYVVDYVLVHELAHLLEPSHDDALLGAGARLPAGRAGAGLPRGRRVRPGPTPAPAADGDELEPGAVA